MKPKSIIEREAITPEFARKAKDMRARAQRFYDKCLDLPADVPGDEVDIVEMMAQVRADLKQVDENRRTATRPYRMAARARSDVIAPVTTILQAAKKILEDKKVAVVAIKQSAAAAERAGREEVHAERMSDVRAETARDVEARGENQLKSPLAKTSTRHIRDVVIDDVGLLPREYMKPDYDRIKKDALAGKQIPGVRETVREVTVVRTIPTEKSDD